MALVLSNQGASGFELAFKSVWARANDDGVGVVWRDFEKKSFHLARFDRSEELGKVMGEYDRQLIHFRKATRGLGTHPFTCRCKPKNKSGEWLMVHNGSVQDGQGRTRLEKTHDFSTMIDSEALVHLWGELPEGELLARAKAFEKLREEYNISGWANLIFYNVVTDEWVAFCDGSLHLVYSANTMVVCSDTEWLNKEEAKKKKIKSIELKDGTVAYGKGNQATMSPKVWKIGRVVVETYSRENNYAGYSNPNVGRSGFYQNGVWKRNNFTEVGHKFEEAEVTTDEGEKICKECYLPESQHKILYEDEEPDSDMDEDEYTPLNNQKGKWANIHTFVRDMQADGIRCKCGATTSYSRIHEPHQFDAVKEHSVYCKTCGSTRTTGNHKMENAVGHYFIPKFYNGWANGIRTELPSNVCQRCGYGESLHTYKEEPRTQTPALLPPPPATTPSIPSSKKDEEQEDDNDDEAFIKTDYTNGKGTIMIKPTGCKCDLKGQVKMICQVHVAEGFKFAQDGYLVKEYKLS